MFTTRYSRAARGALAALTVLALPARIAFALLAPLALPALLAAQQPPPKPDSARAARDTLETVVIRAVRGALAPPAAQHEVTRADLQRRFAGQDAPLFLTTTPSVTSYSEAGGFSGYSYIRLRGIDQTRLNITIDGVPLNDPEDQVLYFSNVPDFLNSIESVQLTRGVGTSTFGTASWAGSLNFQSVPIATTARGGQLDLTAGSFGTARASVQGATGVLAKGWAAYGRVSQQRTDGYREHSGNDSRSAFASAGWFGVRDAVKLTGFAGISGTRLAYYATSEDDLERDRRVNPLGADEGDRFHQEMVSVQYARAFGDGLTVNATAYRNSAAGAYDVRFDSATMANFFLAHVWYGGIAALSWRSGALSLDAGAHASDYHREHALAYRPNLNAREYDNTGFKQEQSGFVKGAYDVGALRLSGDLQVRRAAFRYQPSANAGIAARPSIAWTFVNPKAGVTWKATQTLSLYASYGVTSREPARGDLFAGADNLDSSNAADLLPLTKVRPERVHDFEGGATWTSGGVTLNANAFDMEFRNEIAAIGKLALTGNPLRQNVPRSYRRGVELDGRWRANDRLSFSGNVTLMAARIAEYRDEASGATYRNVEPLATPPVIANAQADFRWTDHFSFTLSPRYVARSQLANDGNPALVAPAYTLVDGGVTWRAGRCELRVQGLNLFDANAYAAGYASGTTRYFYPVATRNLLVTTRFSF